MSVNVALVPKLIALPPGPPGAPVGYLVGAGGPTSGDASGGQILHQYTLPASYGIALLAVTAAFAAVASTNDITGFRFFPGISVNGVDEFVVGRSSKQETESTAGVAVNSGRTWKPPRVIYLPDEGGTAPFVDCFGTNGGGAGSFISSFRALIWPAQDLRQVGLEEMVPFLAY